ncbi:M23 family metallopeptidase [Ruminococcaceae bacterium OttesenSCG-928-L11]|nr:M23 family metallopeptidase [Ruminococcaceae bacterium OttesenSCG-928-L11]
MSGRKKLKARGKMTLKNTRGGVILHDTSTGEDTRLTTRESAFDLRGKKADTFSLDGKNHTTKPMKRKPRPKFEQFSPQENPQSAQPDAAESKSESPASAQVHRSPQIDLSNTEVAAQTIATSAHISPERGAPPAITDKPAVQTKRKAILAHSNTLYENAQQIDSRAENTSETSVINPNILENTADSPDVPKHDITTPTALKFDAISPDTFENVSNSPASKLKPTPTTPKPDAINSDALENIPKSSEASAPARKQARAQNRTDITADKIENALSNSSPKPSVSPRPNRLRFNQTIDNNPGKVAHKLRFHSEVKTHSEAINSALPLRPVEVATSAVQTLRHSKLQQAEEDNVGVEAAHKAENLVENGARVLHNRHKSASRRRAKKRDRRSAKNIRTTKKPTGISYQKRKIKQNYAKAARESEQAVIHAKKAGAVTARLSKAVVGSIKRHPVILGVAALVALLLFSVMSLIGVFGSSANSGLGGILATSYLAEDADIEAAELAYTQWETDLLLQVETIENDHPNYDEYIYNIDPVYHNPHELMAYLTAVYQSFVFADIEADLREIFDEQYTLTLTPTSETRYGDPYDYDEDGDYEPYEHTILTITLTALPFRDVIAAHLDDVTQAHHNVLTETNGSRKYIENPFDFNWLPYVTSPYGYRIHPTTGEKNLHRGVDIGLPLGTEIRAGHDGTVTFAGWHDSYGYYVAITNDNGISTKYAHCSQLLVSAGQTVQTGEVIALVGSTGVSTGPHLHLELLKDGQYLNPIYFTGGI